MDALLKKLRKDYGWLYVIELSDDKLTDEGNDLLKIGFSIDVGKRLADLQTAMPFKYAVTWRFRMFREGERYVHRLLKPYRHSREWYRDCPDIENFLEDLYDYTFIAASRCKDMYDDVDVLEMMEHIDITPAVKNAKALPLTDWYGDDDDLGQTIG